MSSGKNKGVASGSRSPVVEQQRWHLSDRFDPPTRKIADRHYNRQKIGSPQFVPPGRCVVLSTPDYNAFWVTSWPFAEYVKHAWPGAWVCSAFRNERRDLYVSSELVRDALADRDEHYKSAMFACSRMEAWERYAGELRSALRQIADGRPMLEAQRLAIAALTLSPPGKENDA